MTTNNKGHLDYNPCAKYDYILKTLCHNMNVISEKADDDQCLDETTWAFSGYAGEAGCRVIGKPAVTRGGQTVTLYDVNHQFPQTYSHQHSLVEKHFTQQDPNELYDILKQVKQLTKDGQDEFQTKYGRKDFVKGKFHVTCDNHFSGNNICQSIGKNGFACTNTIHIDCLPCQTKFLHHQKQIDTHSKRCKSACYKNPIVAAKQVHSTPTTKPYTLTLTSFQSTGTTNITCINTLAEISLFYMQREQGRGASKRIWAIEYNHERKQYLGYYDGKKKVAIRLYTAFFHITQIYQNYHIPPCIP